MKKNDRAPESGKKAMNFHEGFADTKVPMGTKMKLKQKTLMTAEARNGF